MPSPLPGMDSYLEDDKLWSIFHMHLVHSLYQLLLPGLMDRYRARLAERRYVLEQALFTSIVARSTTSRTSKFASVPTADSSRWSTSSAPPTRPPTRAVRHISPSGRSSAAAAPASSNIDLVLQGQPLQDYVREGPPEWDYAVLVTRSIQPDRYEIYTATMDKRLPRFRLPLASDDRDTVLDLQAAVVRSYDQGDFVKQVDYQKDPVTKLGDFQKKWLDDKLRDQKVRK